MTMKMVHTPSSSWTVQPFGWLLTWILLVSLTTMTMMVVVVVGERAGVYGGEAEHGPMAMEPGAGVMVGERNFSNNYYYKEKTDGGSRGRRDVLGLSLPGMVGGSHTRSGVGTLGVIAPGSTCTTAGDTCGTASGGPCCPVTGFVNPVQNLFGKCCRDGEFCLCTVCGHVCCPENQVCGITCCPLETVCMWGDNGQSICCPKSRVCTEPNDKRLTECCPDNVNFCCGAGGRCEIKEDNTAFTNSLMDPC